jgi:PhzF family phenazine biosynthesis protein
VAIPDWETLHGLEPDLAAVRDISERLDLIGYYVFTRRKDGFVATTRMFAPRYGIDEESATGMAAGPLACHLKDHLGVDDEAMFIQQGVAMPHPSPSRLHVELEMGDGGIRRLFAGGVAKVVRSLSLQV